MLNIIIITILIFLLCFLLMFLGQLVNEKSIKGSCGNSSDNPCTCSIFDKMNCDKNQSI